MKRARSTEYMAWVAILIILSIVAAFSATNVFPANLEEITTSDAAIVRLQGGGE